MAIPCVGVHPLIFHRVAQIVRALDLVGGDNISVVSLDPLTRLEEVAEDLVKNSNVIEASIWVGTLDPYQVPPIIITPISQHRADLNEYLWEASQFLVFASPVCGIRKSIPSMDIRQSLPMSFIFRSSKLICGVGSGGSRGERMGMKS
jgi:hypothetical protein